MTVHSTTGAAAYLDVLLVELGVVLQEALWLHPNTLLGLQVIIVVVAPLHPVFHPGASIITWTHSVFYISNGEQQTKLFMISNYKTEQFFTFILFLIFNLGQVVLVGLGTLGGDAIQSCPRVTKSSQGLSCITTVHCLVDRLDGLRDCGHKTQVSAFTL